MREQAANTISDSSHLKARHVILVHAIVLSAAVGLFLILRAYGESMATAHSSVAPASTAPAPRDDVFLHLLLALVTVVVVSQGLGTVFSRCAQPRVIGEVVAGILLGPSLLGAISPASMAFVLPLSIVPLLGVLAQTGVIVYMFLVGLDLNASLLRSRAHASVAISHASIVAPFVLGALLALWLYPRLAPDGVRFTSFALFMGVAMAITAFPVLARILTDQGLEKTELGVLSLGCAAVDYVSAWCLLALSVGVAQSDLNSALRVVLLTLGYVALMFGVAGPVAARWLKGIQDEHEEALPTSVVVTALVALLLSSLAAEAIGIHAIFGAFLLGAILPHDSPVARVFRRKLEDIVTILLLPAYFAYTGLRTQIGLLHGWDEWLVCAIIILLATAGKFGGTLAAARFTGLGWRTSASLGILMNTRGLMELVVLNIGLDLGVISPALFAMMVVMALVTTLATTPALRLVGHVWGSDNPTQTVNRSAADISSQRLA